MRPQTIIRQFVNDNCPLPLGEYIEHNMDLSDTERHITEKRFYGTPVKRNKDMETNTLRVSKYSD